MTSKTSQRLFAFFFALLLTLTLTTNAFAAPLQNGQFENHYGCSMNGWSTSVDNGVVTTVDGTSLNLYKSDDCVAKVHSEKPAGYPTSGVYYYSTLSQTFDVPTTNGISGKTLSFYMWPKSGNGAPGGSENSGGFPSQIISVQAGSTMAYNKARNMNVSYGQVYLVEIDLSGYAGQTVELKIQTRVHSTISTSPTYSTLFVNDMRFGRLFPRGLTGEYDW